MSDVKPFTPDMARAAKLNAIPQEVITAVNQLLAEHLVSEKEKATATIPQDVITARIRQLTGLESNSEIFRNNWLDFEPIFRQSGWLVAYHKPSIGEDFAAYFKFTEK